MTDIAPHLQRALALFDGNQTALARRAGVSQHAIWYAVRNNRVGPRLAIAIDEATGGAVKRSDLRPDLWPAPEKETTA